MYLLLHFNDEHIYINTIIIFRKFPEVATSTQEGEMSHCIHDLPSSKRSAPLSPNGLSALQERKKFLKYSAIKKQRRIDKLDCVLDRYTALE